MLELFIIVVGVLALILVGALIGGLIGFVIGFVKEVLYLPVLRFLAPERYERQQQIARLKLERRRAEEERRQRGINIIKNLRALSPNDFEHAIMQLLGGQATRAVGDRGIDGWAGDIPVQIKQSDKVSRPVVDGFETAIR